MIGSMKKLTELKTPKLIVNTEITLPKTMYDSSNNEYTKMTSETPTETLLKLSW